MTDELTVLCGPHVRKRHGSEYATVALARVLRAPGRARTVCELYGVVEQRLYRASGAEVWDEYASPTDPDLAKYYARDRDPFDERWAAGERARRDQEYQTLLGMPPTPVEVAVRERALLRCPVCSESLPIGRMEELHELANRLTSAGMTTITLAGLRRARGLSGAQDGSVR